ncbi:probable indole-3-pyruvate monooxygenase YUCCA10 [Miscanthus floridulus]|uniref:probable indole-3-pyruvate monooxygenase YUCCA10 n=1 Tax=Miscanthus floridulus TaxID=154761 RepID=UPI003457BD15
MARGLGLPTTPTPTPLSSRAHNASLGEARLLELGAAAVAMAAAVAVAEQEDVIIVGAGQSGLAVAACLSLRGVRALVLERDDCVGSLWRKRAYDRLHLHLGKKYSALPHAPHPDSAPTYLHRDEYAAYLDGYAARFAVRTRLCREVRCARYDPASARWVMEAVDLGGTGGQTERYKARFLVVASGENAEKFVPEVPGLEAFPGEVMHAAEYRSAEGMRGKAVLVVGSGNSGMEIAYDLAAAGAVTSIVVRSELHLVTKEIWNVAMALYPYLPAWVIDKLVLLMCAVVFGDTSRHGLRRPAVGPFTMKLTTPAYPVVDVGTYDKIRTGEIRVLPAGVKSVRGNVVEFGDGKRHPFDAIVFATGYRSTVRQWLKSEDGLIGDDGMAARSCPEHWKGDNGLYCAGMVRRGIYGSCEDAELIAGDISKLLRPQQEQEQGNGF